MPIAQYKGLQDGGAPQNFSNRSKLSPRSADDIELGTLLGSTLLHARYVCISVHSPSCVSYLCLIFFFSDVPERTSVCFRFLFFCGSYLFVFFILADIPAKVVACFPSLSFSLYLIFLCFCSLQMFLRKFWRVFCPSLSLCFLSFCASVPCSCSCESFGVFSVPFFVCVSYLFVLLFLADVPARVGRVFRPFLCLCFLSFCASIPCRCSCESLACFPSLSFSVFLATISPPTVPLYSLQHVSRDKSQGKNPSNKSRSHIFLPEKLPQPSDLR